MIIQNALKMKTVIIEDEQKSSDLLRHLLAEVAPGMEILGEVPTISQALPIINEQEPDLIFLDIELPQQNGFSLFDYFPRPSFHIIFTTAYDKYAVQAFRMAAVDYLLKPIKASQLQEAINRVKERQNFDFLSQHLGVLRNNINNAPPKLALPSANGFLFVNIQEIIRCEAARNYAFFYLTSGKKIVVSRPLKTFAKLLESFSFFRANRSHLVNLQFVKSYARTKQGEITTQDGVVIPLTERSKEAFLSLNIFG